MLEHCQYRSFTACAVHGSNVAACTTSIGTLVFIYTRIGRDWTEWRRIDDVCIVSRGPHHHGTEVGPLYGATLVPCHVRWGLSSGLSRRRACAVVVGRIW